MVKLTGNFKIKIKNMHTEDNVYKLQTWVQAEDDLESLLEEW